MSYSLFAADTCFANRSFAAEVEEVVLKFDLDEELRGMQESLSGARWYSHESRGASSS